MKVETSKTPSYLLRRYKWSNIIVVFIWHVLALAAYYHNFFNSLKLNTLIFGAIISISGGIGIVVGAHRLWAHRTFRACLPLKIFLMLAHASSMNGPAYSYARDHRQHHKFSDSDVDPKDPRRGLFYSHIGWWMFKKEAKVIEAGKKLDFSDLYADRVLMFEKHYYIPLFTILGLVLPTLIPYVFFDENLWTAFYTCVVFRVTIILHHFFTVNSLAHFFGQRPYDFRIRPRENRLVCYLSLGEGQHNYHHSFPYDYRSSPLGVLDCFNPGTMIIELFGLLGLAWDFKKASPAVINEIIEKRGLKGKALFDQRRSFWYRVVYSIGDNILGLATIFWWIYPIFIYKYFKGLPFVV